MCFCGNSIYTHSLISTVILLRLCLAPLWEGWHIYVSFIQEFPIPEGYFYLDLSTLSCWLCHIFLLILLFLAGTFLTNLESKNRQKNPHSCVNRSTQIQTDDRGSMAMALTPTLRSRLQGCLVGAVSGDCLGAPYEICGVPPKDTFGSLTTFLEQIGTEIKEKGTHTNLFTLSDSPPLSPLSLHHLLYISHSSSVTFSLSPASLSSCFTILSSVPLSFRLSPLFFPLTPPSFLSTLHHLHVLFFFW